jgi:hypothetical protein
MAASGVYVLLVLHSVTGAEIDINAAEITSMRESREDDANDKLVVQGVRCVVSMTDGKFASVKEHCSEIHDQIDARLEQAAKRLEGIIRKDE